MSSDPHDFITIKETSRILKVTRQTLRNWDKTGKLVAYRHPLNNYRLYKKDDLYRIVDLMNIPMEEREDMKNTVRKIEVRHEE